MFPGLVIGSPRRSEALCSRTVSDDESLLAANAAFYQAMNRRDAAGMDELWAQQTQVACIHPGWHALMGREEVMESWRAILENPETPRIRCADPRAHFVGTAAFVICLETIGQNTLIATNVFVRESGRWRLVHHHAAPTSPRRSAPKPPSRDLN